VVENNLAASSRGDMQFDIHELVKLLGFTQRSIFGGVKVNVKVQVTIDSMEVSGSGTKDVNSGFLPGLIAGSLVSVETVSVKGFFEEFSDLLSELVLGQIVSLDCLSVLFYRPI